jgi:hypothetical protein
MPVKGTETGRGARKVVAVSDRDTMGDFMYSTFFLYSWCHLGAIPEVPQSDL